MSVLLPLSLGRGWRVGGSGLVLMAACASSVGQTVGATTMPLERNTRHALIIGIGEYRSADIPTLRGVVMDVESARRMARAMVIPDAQITVVRDRDATAERIRAEIAALHSRLKDGDRVFIYYSGHGTRTFDESVNRQGCTEGLMASDGEVLSNAEMGARLAPLARRADKMLVFYDACFSGGVAEAPLRTRALRQGAATITPKFSAAVTPQLCAQPSNFRTRTLAQVLQQRQAVAQNVVHIAASRPDEASFDSSVAGGFATVAWRDCLLGQANDLDRSGAVTVDEVTACAQLRVDKALSGQPGVSGQHLTVAGNGSFVPAWMGSAFVSVPQSNGSAAPGIEGALAAIDPARLLAEVHGQRDGRRSVDVHLQAATLKIGVDGLRLDVTAGHDGYLYIAQAGSDGHSLVLLYPNELATDNRVRAGQALALPDRRWDIVPGGPAGVETLLVMVSDVPRDLSALRGDRAGPYLKTLLDDAGRARLQWVLGHGMPRQDCGAADAEGCSDAFGSTLVRVQTVR